MKKIIPKLTLSILLANSFLFANDNSNSSVVAQAIKLLVKDTNEQNKDLKTLKDSNENNLLRIASLYRKLEAVKDSNNIKNKQQNKKLSDMSKQLKLVSKKLKQLEILTKDLPQIKKDKNNLIKINFIKKPYLSENSINNPEENIEQDSKQSNKVGIITAYVANARKEPFADSEKIDLLNIGKIVKIKRVLADWIETDKGYIYKKNIVLLSNKFFKKYRVATDKLNVRKLPNVSINNTVKSLNRNDIVEIYPIQFKNGWLLTKDGNFVSSVLLLEIKTEKLK